MSIYYTGKDVENADTRYYVYAHLDNGKPVYIGKGEGGRAWVTKRHMFSHLQWMYKKLPNNLEVEIIADGLTSKEAHRLEACILRHADFDFNVDKKTRRANSARGAANRVKRKQKQSCP